MLLKDWVLGAAGEVLLGLRMFPQPWKPPRTAAEWELLARPQLNEG